MTGTYAGQFAMEGFLNLKWKRWQRVLLTRTVAILPTFLVAFYENIEDLSGMNDLLNCLMSLQLPFALIPTIAFTSNIRIMGADFVNGIVNRYEKKLFLIYVCSKSRSQIIFRHFCIHLLLFRKYLSIYNAFIIFSHF